MCRAGGSGAESSDPERKREKCPYRGEPPLHPVQHVCKDMDQIPIFCENNQACSWLRGAAGKPHSVMLRERAAIGVGGRS